MFTTVFTLTHLNLGIRSRFFIIRSTARFLQLFLSVFCFPLTACANARGLIGIVYEDGLLGDIAPEESQHRGDVHPPSPGCLETPSQDCRLPRGQVHVP